MKLVLCLLAALPSFFSLRAQTPEERIPSQGMLIYFQDHHMLLASNTTEESGGESTQTTRIKKRITKAEARDCTPAVVKACMTSMEQSLASCDCPEATSLSEWASSFQHKCRHVVL